MNIQLDKMDAKIKKYIKNKLDIKDYNLDSRSAEERLSLLNEIIEKIMGCVPYQNLTYISENRTVTLKENLESNLGGFCFSMNLLLKRVLDVVGFKCSMAESEFNNLNLDHTFVLVFDVMKEGDIYVADTCISLPTFCATPLDMEDGVSSTLYNVFPGHYSYRYTRRGDTYVFQQLISNKRDDKNFLLVEKAWKEKFGFKLKGCIRSDQEMEELHEKNIHGKISKLYNLKNIVVQLWGKEQSVIIFNNTVRILCRDGKYDHIQLETGKEIIQKIYLYFPMIPKATVESAIHKWCYFTDFPMSTFQSTL